MTELGLDLPLQSTIHFEKTALLEAAFRKVFSLREIRSTAGRDKVAQNEITTCINQAYECVNNLCYPKGRYLQVHAKPDEENILLEDSCRISNMKMYRALKQESIVIVYLVTCGYDSREAFKVLASDYVLYYFQHIIGRELLYGAARELHKEICNKLPAYQFTRYAIRLRKDCLEAERDINVDGYQSIWDPAKVIELLSFFGEQRICVNVTEGGCFSPLHSMLGLMLGTPSKEG